MADMPSHKDARELAWMAVAHEKPQSIATNSGATLHPGKKVLQLRLIDRECLIDRDARTIRWASDKQGEIGLHLQIIVLHYLAGSGNAQLANRLATFRDFEGGAIYYPAFKARSIDMIVKEFGAKAEILKHIGDVIRAEPSGIGTVGLKVDFFPKFPIVVVLWEGDEEIPASANILFDANAGKILPTEDLSVASGVLVRRLVDISRK